VEDFVFHLVKALLDEAKYGGWIAAILVVISLAIAFLVNPVSHEPAGCIDGHLAGQPVQRDAFGQPKPSFACLKTFHEGTLLANLVLGLVGAGVGIVIAGWFVSKGASKETLGITED
jgi:hypothetical protein